MFLQPGIWLHESGVLGASPDGIVMTPPSGPVHFQDGVHTDQQPDIVEVKCPYSARELTVLEAVTILKDFYLSKFTIVDAHGFFCIYPNVPTLPRKSQRSPILETYASV